MEVTIYTYSYSISVEGVGYGRLKTTIDVDIEELLSQLDAVPKADYTVLNEEYINLVDRHSELQEAYDELRSKFEMLDP